MATALDSTPAPTDLDVRRVDPKGQEKIVKHDILGTIGDRFGASKRETTFM